MKIKILSPEDQRNYRRRKNMEKHMRIARATTGAVREKHLQKAKGLLDKYKSLDEKATVS
jgi:hypothetical protein